MNRGIAKVAIWRNNLSLTDFARWFKDLDPFHKLMVVMGIAVLLIGISSFMLSVLRWDALDAYRVLLVASGIFLTFSGLVIIQIAIRFAIARR